MKRKTKEKGITLVSLAVTIIVILILAAVTVRIALGDGGVLDEAQLAANEWDKAVTGEQSDLAKLANEMRKARNGIVINGGSTGGEGGNTGGNNNETGGNTGGDNEDQETRPTHAPSSNTPNSAVSFITETGKIDVIWLDTNNKVISQPNNPANHLGGMVPVKWDGVAEVETTTSDSNWYSYTSIEGGGDNTTSHWANAKNYGSYFVWIPRYAYRITYYASNSSQPTGYYDGCGMWKATGELKLSLEDGIETVVKDGWSYIVHPAFINDRENGYANGGWDRDLAGIWVGKYEVSRSDATYSSVGSSSVIKVAPGVRSWRSVTVNTCYNNSYNYERTKESHMMKNSEWGAVVYLTYSQYGRNGNTIDENQNVNGITGGGIISRNKYNTIIWL